MRIGAAAAAYFGMVFAIAFALGILRTLWLAPLLDSALLAVLCEVPLVLGASWIVAGQVLRRWRVARVGEATAMGMIAFAMLMAAEAMLAMLVFGQSPDAWLAGMTTAAGVVGLVGQMLFGAVPAVRVLRGV